MALGKANRVSPTCWCS